MKKTKLTDFLLQARTKTYAGAGGQVKPVFSGLTQLEYRNHDWLYRDIYYTGRGIFMGLETVYFRDHPVWSMSYYGNFRKLTEKEIDRVLRKALLENWNTTRIWKKVEWVLENYSYECIPDSPRSIDEMSGSEKIYKSGKEVYFFFYAGGAISR